MIEVVGRLKWFIVLWLALFASAVSSGLWFGWSSELLADPLVLEVPQSTQALQTMSYPVDREIFLEDVARESPVSSTTSVLPVDSGQSLEMLALVNAYRQRNGRSPLELCANLTESASRHSEDMAINGYFDHVSPEGFTPSDRMVATGYGPNGGENIAVGYQSTASVMDAWINSPGHRENLLNYDYVHFGSGRSSGVFEGSNADFWTQNFGFGGSCEGTPQVIDESHFVNGFDNSDPRFATCKDAISHGYGPYARGIDEEYDWYRDRDGDGLNCER